MLFYRFPLEWYALSALESSNKVSQLNVTYHACLIQANLAHGFLTLHLFEEWALSGDYVLPLVQTEEGGSWGDEESVLERTMVSFKSMILFTKTSTLTQWRTRQNKARAWMACPRWFLAHSSAALISTELASKHIKRAGFPERNTTCQLLHPERVDRCREVSREPKSSGKIVETE
jgi:hypothetical protein